MYGCDKIGLTFKLFTISNCEYSWRKYNLEKFDLRRYMTCFASPCYMHALIGRVDLQCLKKITTARKLTYSIKLIMYLYLIL